MKEVLKEKLEKLIKDFKQSLEFAKSNGVKYEHIQEEYDFYNEIKETIEELENNPITTHDQDELLYEISNLEITIEKLNNDLKVSFDENESLRNLNHIQRDSIDCLNTMFHDQISYINELKERINELKYEVEGLVNIAVKDEDEEVEKVDETLNKIQLIQQLKDLGYEEYNNIGGSIIEFNKEVNDDEINLRIDFKQKKFIKFSDDIDSRIYINHDELMIIDKLFKLDY